MTECFNATDQRHLSEGMMYALTAAEEALTDANWKPNTQEQKERTGIYQYHNYYIKQRLLQLYMEIRFLDFKLCEKFKLTKEKLTGLQILIYCIVTKNYLCPWE